MLVLPRSAGTMVSVCVLAEDQAHGPVEVDPDVRGRRTKVREGGRDHHRGRNRRTTRF